MSLLALAGAVSGAGAGIGKALDSYQNYLQQSWLLDDRNAYDQLRQDRQNEWQGAQNEATRAQADAHFQTEQTNLQEYRREDLGLKERTGNREYDLHKQHYQVQEQQGENTLEAQKSHWNAMLEEAKLQSAQAIKKLEVEESRYALLKGRVEGEKKLTPLVEELKAEERREAGLWKMLADPLVRSDQVRSAIQDEIQSISETRAQIKDRIHKEFGIAPLDKRPAPQQEAIKRPAQYQELIDGMGRASDSPSVRRSRQPLIPAPSLSARPDENIYGLPNAE